MQNAKQERLRLLDVFVGTWDTTITLLDQDGTEGAISKATDTYGWMANGHFLLHDVDAEIDGQHILSMEVIALDDSGPGYATRSYDADGSTSDFIAELSGEQWCITGSHQRFDGSFSADRDTLTGRWEQRDGSEWHPLMTVRLIRRS
ncbi:DUF1579 family protein [Devosia sp. Root105]|uniref:DUF1579 family protein n=1 Tax=Devosia sp. Root105 TaxID=1736423 RepID=UPI0006FAB287|nr:DUF1579 family protein [Devosia sp. Root105]KQU97310.1 hypothetical protein ASC68_10855 [Devosia sp. Root105]